MMWRAICGFELRYQCRRWWPWMVGLGLFVVSVLVTRDGMLSDAMFEDFHVNSPYAVATVMVVGLMLWLLLSPGIAGDAGARDVATGIHPLMFTTPVSRTAYLGGRYLAALTINLVVLAAIPLGALVAVHTPFSWWSLPPESLGPFRVAAYVTAYLYVGVPTVLVGTALQFTIAVRTGRPMSAYLGSVSLFFLSHGVGLFLFIQGRQQLASLLDPIGVHFILSDLSHHWTTTQKSQQLLTLEGALLLNRVLWLVVASLTLVWLHAGFRFAHRVDAARPWWTRALQTRRNMMTRVEHAGAPGAHAADVARQVVRSSGLVLHLHQWWAVSRESFRTIVTSWAGRAMLVGLPLLTIAVVIDQLTVNGVPLAPRTALVLREITGPLSSEMSRWVIVPLLMAWFAGELVWRERDAGVSDITDAMPGSTWARALGKMTGLALVIVLFVLLLALAGVAAQVLSGHTDVEPWLYLRVMLGLQLPQYLLFVPLAVLMHVLANHKYVGHVLAVMVYVLMALGPLFGIEHPMLSYGAAPSWSYTEMRGFGWSLAPWFWFTAYWTAWAVLLAVATHLLWVRGHDQHAAHRAGRAAQRFISPGRVGTRVTAIAATMLVVGLGAFVFFNTNVLNRYHTRAQSEALQAEYERRYAYVARLPQPSVAHTTATLEFLTEARTVTAAGVHTLVNTTGASIDTVHVDVSPDTRVDSLRLDVPATLVHDDEALHHRVYALHAPLAAGASMSLHFEVRSEANGFTTRGISEAVAHNGSQVSSTLLPSVGYRASRELLAPGERRRHGLAARPVIARLDDSSATASRKPGVWMDLTIGTDLGQTGAAPGAVTAEWSDQGRQYMRYVTSAPIGEEFAILAARYQVRTSTWKHVAIRLLHHPTHHAAIPRMLESIEAALAVYTERYGPYPYTHLIVAEHPGNGSGMHADAGILTFSEGFTQWRAEPGKLDMPFAVVAHEMGHQWNIPYASVEGAPVMSESVAWYLAWQVVAQHRGALGLRQLHTFMHQPSPYPPIRRGEPLMRGLDPYMAYRKGPFALQAVHTMIGAEAMDGVFRRLLARHRDPSAPLATTRDLYRELRAAAPDSVHTLLHDLFEVNTNWQLTLLRASATPQSDSTWRVTLDVRARKSVYDSAGQETQVPFTDWVDVAVYAAADATTPTRDRLAHVLYQGRHRLRNGQQTLTLTVSGKPALAGVDPLHVLDWEELDGDNNFVRVETGLGILPR